MKCFFEKVKIEDFSDVKALIRKVETLSLNMKFSSFEAANLKLAVSEISTNVLKYAENGLATIYYNECNREIEITVDDSGPGITFVELAAIDGYSTFRGPSLGLGLGAAGRSVDSLKVENKVGGGLKVRLKKTSNFTGNT